MPVALPLIDVAVGVAGLLLVAAAVAIAVLVADIFGGLPVIGPAVQGRVNSAVLGAIAKVVVWSNQSANGLASAIAGPVLSIWLSIDALVTEDWNIVQTVRGIATVTIPRVVDWAWQADLYVERQALAYTDAARSAIVAWVGAWVAQLIDYVNVRVAYLVAYTDSTRSAIVGWVVTWVAELVAKIEAGDAQAARYAEALAAQEAGYARSLVGAAVGSLEGEIARERARADAEVGQVVEWAQQGLQDLARGIEAAEGRAEAFAAAGVGVVAVAVQALEDSPCQRFCGPLGGLGQYLQQLEDAGLVVALIALAGEGARDPQGTAAGLVELFGGPLQAAGQEVRQEAGV